MSARCQFFLAILPLLGAGSATAAEYYVDAVNGSNANTGTSAASPWQTISHALAVVPGGDAHTIHVAPGLYDSALGESFWLPLRHQITVVGDQGSAATVIDAGGSTVMGGSASTFGASISSSLKGFTLRNGNYGFSMAVMETNAHMGLTLEDVVIEGASQGAVYGEIFDFGEIFTGAGMSVTLDRVRIEGCGFGIGLYDYEAHGSLHLVAHDSDVIASTGYGIEFQRGSSTSATVSLERCRIVGNGSTGVIIGQSSGASTSATIANTLIADNGGDGLLCTGGGASFGFGNAKLCTIAGNAGAGVSVPTTAGFGLGLENCILFGNGDDVSDPFGNITARFGDVGDGDFAGVNGNFSADPLFRDSASGDYRLTWSSPCVESGDPVTASGTLDLHGTKRHVDGDLDALELVDVGAFEFIPLGTASEAHVGQNLVFELWGAAGGSARLYLARNLPQPSPLVTPFGDFDLDPTAFRNLGSSPIAPGPPALRVIPIPNQLDYIGLTFSFQALSSSSAAPQGAAYTNPVTITVQP